MKDKWFIIYQDFHCDLYLQSKIRNHQATCNCTLNWPNVRFVVTFNCILNHFFSQRKNGHSIIRTLSIRARRTVEQGIRMGTWPQCRIFSVLSDCGKISLLYSDIFPFFSYNEGDWWRQQQKKNNYRRWESTTTQNSIILSRRVNHFRKGSEDKPF